MSGWNTTSPSQAATISAVNPYQETHMPKPMSKKSKSVPPFASEALDLTVPIEPAPKIQTQINNDKRTIAKNRLDTLINPIPKKTKKVPVGPVMDAEDKKRVDEVRAKIDSGMYKEIADFEKTAGKPWWTFANKGETWESFKRRGCPVAPPEPVVVPATQRGYAGLSQTTQDRSGTKNPVATRSEPRSPAGPQAKRQEPASPRVKKEPASPLPFVKLTPPAGAAEMSNKEIVYRKWLEETTPQANVPALAALVPDVAESSVRSWTGGWAKGNNLPKIAKELPPTLRGTLGKKEEPKQKGRGKK